MSNPNVDAHLEELDRIPRTLRQGAADLNAPAGKAPEPPDAGQSTAALAGALHEVSQQILAMSKDLEQMATNVAQSRGVYQETDADNARKFQPNGNEGH